MEKRELIVIICNHVKIYHDNCCLFNNKSNLEVFRIDTDDDAIYDLKNEDEIGYKWMKSIQSFINKI